MALRRWSARLRLRRPLGNSFASTAPSVNVVVSTACASNAAGASAGVAGGDGESNAKVDTTTKGGLGITFLGTCAGGNISLDRNVSSLLLMLPGRCWMFDCGEGTQRQLFRCNAPGAAPKRVERIFITHMHGDHVLGLPGFLCALNNSSPRTEPFFIYGPIGIKAFVHDCLRHTCTKLHMSLIFRELSKDQILKGSDAIPIFEDSQFKVVAAPIKHTLPCWGYVVREKDISGTLDARRLESDGLPRGPMYAKIKRGEDVVHVDGRVFRSRDYVSPDIRGRKITILGDTCDPSSIAAAAEGSDLLIHEATAFDRDATVAASRGHSSAGMAGSFARLISAGFLALNHLSPKVGKSGKFLHERNVDVVAEARATFRSQRVIAAFDFMALSLERPSDKGSATST